MCLFVAAIIAGAGAGAIHYQWNVNGNSWWAEGGDPAGTLKAAGDGAALTAAAATTAVDAAVAIPLAVTYAGVKLNNPSVYSWGATQSGLLPPADAQFVGYHGTSSTFAPSIRNGVRPPTGANFDGKSQLGEGFYTTMDDEAAYMFAQHAAGKHGGDPVLMPVYARGYNNMTGTSVPEYANNRRLWWNIQPDSPYVTNFDYLRAPINGMEWAEQTKFNPRVYGSLIAK